MSMPDELMKYSVILNFSSGLSYPKLFDLLCNKIISTDGSYLLHFWCSKVNADHPLYLEIVSHKPDDDTPLSKDDPGFRLRIPHHMVLLIADPPVKSKVLGFSS